MACDGHCERVLDKDRRRLAKIEIKYGGFHAVEVEVESCLRCAAAVSALGPSDEAAQKEDGPQ